MIKVGISGANGTMGRLTIAAIEAVDDLAVGGLYAPGRNDQDILGTIASGDPALGTIASGDPAALSECDVVIELTNPSAADENVPRWRDSGADVLIGTSGYTVARIDALRRAWSGLPSRCLVVPNTTSWCATEPWRRSECTGIPSTSPPSDPAVISDPRLWAPCLRAAAMRAAV